MFRDPNFPYLPKDFIETEEGLIFAVVSYQPEEGKVGCFLRYIFQDQAWQKVGTEKANTLLKQHYPHYLYHSKQSDAYYHAVAIEDIVQHHQPEQRLHKVLQKEAADEIELKLQQLIPILVQYGADSTTLGLTGSMLINRQTPHSDIDLVVYGRDAFQQTRQAVKRAVDEGVLSLLDHDLMVDNFKRRLGELSFEDFSWHENRKYNKAVIKECKFDIGMVCFANERQQDYNSRQKQGKQTIIAKVMDDRFAFDFPARYVVDNNELSEIVSFTHTYVGQAQQGERIEVSGAVERDMTTGKCRIVVGSSREAEGEYIKVCK